MKKRHYQSRISEYVDELASRAPAPGGGSVAALSGVMAAALLEMVGNYTLKNKKYKDVETEIKAEISHVKKQRKILVKLMEKDSHIYEKYTQLKKKSVKDELKKNVMIQDLLIEMTYIPLEVCKIATVLLKTAKRLFLIGNRYLLVDAAVASKLLYACFSSSQMNITVNLKAVGDEKLSIAVAEESANEQKTFMKLYSQVEQLVQKKIN